jgi:hypothetical protein
MSFGMVHLLTTSLIYITPEIHSTTLKMTRTTTPTVVAFSKRLRLAGLAKLLQQELKSFPLS